jgi:multiple sugar transport system substrate-binding protein
MRKVPAWLGHAIFTAGLVSAISTAARADGLVFLSTQLRPIEEAQKVRNVILKDFPHQVDYVTEQPAQLPVRIKAEQQGGAHTIDVVGALHGELQPLVPSDALEPLDKLAGTLGDRGIPDSLIKFGKFGTSHQLYIPWMQASYILVANKQALLYLPGGADINALSYDQLAAWAGAVQEKTGKRLLGFPAGPQGLMHRFFEGFLYPSYTDSVVVPFRSEAAEAMWTQLHYYGKASIPTRRATISCRSRCSQVTCGSPLTILHGCSTHCARGGRNSSLFLPPPGQKGAATCRCWRASR